MLTAQSFELSLSLNRNDLRHEQSDIINLHYNSGQFPVLMYLLKAKKTRFFTGSPLTLLNIFVIHSTLHPPQPKHFLNQK